MRVGEKSNTGNFNSVLKIDRMGPMKANASLLELFINLRKYSVMYRASESRIWHRNCRGDGPNLAVDVLAASYTLSS